MCHFSFLEKQSVSRIYVLWLCAKDILPHYTQQNILNTGKNSFQTRSSIFVHFRAKWQLPSPPLLQPGVSCYPINTCLKEKACDSFFFGRRPKACLHVPTAAFNLLCPSPTMWKQIWKRKTWFYEKSNIVTQGWGNKKFSFGGTFA